jgi:adenosylcobyric acid synthase
MIGEKIADPYHIESQGEVVPGLGLLDLSTVMAPEKTLTRVGAVHMESGEEVHGYEIHHGRTESRNSKPLLRRKDGDKVGAVSADGRVWGTYLHGIFDADGFRRWFIDRLRVRRGLHPLGEIVGTYDLEPAFDRLAEVVRRGLRMEEIYRLTGL